MKGNPELETTRHMNNSKLYKMPQNLRVGHLILRALAIRASNPQNALIRISFHSPKSLPPTPSWSCCSHGRPTCHFAELPHPVLLVPLWIMGSFQVFFFLYLFNNFWNSGNLLPHFGTESLCIFKLTRGTCIDQKQFTCNVVKHMVDQGLFTSMKNSCLRS